jgi:hypothetical protein
MAVGEPIKKIPLTGLLWRKPLAETLDNQIVLLIDLLGFAESISSDNSALQEHVLSLLKRIASMRSDFDLRAAAREDWGSVHDIALSVSTFSDHIVISVPVDRVKSEEGLVARLDNGVAGGSTDKLSI